VLHSPLRFLLGPGICELAYTGRRSRRLVRLPVRYARDGGLVAILSGGARDKTWWRNFHTVQPVHLSIAGRRFTGTAVVAIPATPEFTRALAIYRSRFPNAHYRPGDRLVAVSIQPDHHDVETN
jgi:deazaflavin-dependent oxidoreductase (nitroreductase family)